jgi:SlyX protein
MLEQRIIELEIKVSHQEVLIEELNQVIYEQQKTTDKLEASVARLVKKLQELLAANEESQLPHEKPPHY